MNEEALTKLSRSVAAFSVIFVLLAMAATGMAVKLYADSEARHLRAQQAAIQTANSKPALLTFQANGQVVGVITYERQALKNTNPPELVSIDELINLYLDLRRTDVDIALAKDAEAAAKQAKMAAELVRDAGVPDAGAK